MIKQKIFVNLLFDYSDKPRSIGKYCNINIGENENVYGGEKLPIEIEEEIDEKIKILIGRDDEE